MRKRLFPVILALMLLLSFLLPVPAALAADPTVTITVAAKVIAITNTQATWTAGAIEADEVIYFSADNTQDDDYSQIENTGNVAVDIEIQGTNATGTYSWTLDNTGTPGSETYSLHCNTPSGGATYSTIIKSASYTDITTNLAASGTYDWSMKLTAPTAMNGSDDGSNKTITVTLVASEHV